VFKNKAFYYTLLSHNKILKYDVVIIKLLNTKYFNSLLFEIDIFEKINILANFQI